LASAFAPAHVATRSGRRELTEAALDRVLAVVLERGEAGAPLGRAIELLGPAAARHRIAALPAALAFDRGALPAAHLERSLLAWSLEILELHRVSSSREVMAMDTASLRTSSSSSSSSSHVRGAAAAAPAAGARTALVSAPHRLGVHISRRGSVEVDGLTLRSAAELQREAHYRLALTQAVAAGAATARAALQAGALRADAQSAAAVSALEAQLAARDAEIAVLLATLGTTSSALAGI
tara:strand:+ start:512 stop:1225 length:714 start_codon:yes stop_codon:yes gene_type:complete